MIGPCASSPANRRGRGARGPCAVGHRRHRRAGGSRHPTVLRTGDGRDARRDDRDARRPVILTEEMERRPSTPCSSWRRQSEVIAAKSLSGSSTWRSACRSCSFSRVSRSTTGRRSCCRPLYSRSFLALGLLIAGVFKNATRVYTWSSLFVLLAFGPALAVACRSRSGPMWRAGDTDRAGCV